VISGKSVYLSSCAEGSGRALMGAAVGGGVGRATFTFGRGLCVAPFTLAGGTPGWRGAPAWGGLRTGFFGATSGLVFGLRRGTFGGPPFGVAPGAPAGDALMIPCDAGSRKVGEDCRTNYKPSLTAGSARVAAVTRMSWYLSIMERCWHTLCRL